MAIQAIEAYLLFITNSYAYCCKRIKRGHLQDADALGLNMCEYWI